MLLVHVTPFNDSHLVVQENASQVSHNTVSRIDHQATPIRIGFHNADHLDSKSRL